MLKNKKIKFVEFFFSQTAFTVYGLIIIVLVGTPLYKNIKKQLDVNNEISALENEISHLERRNSELKNLLSYLNSDEFAEEQARLNLNYKKEGEEVLVIKDTAFDEVGNNEEGQKSIYNIKGLESNASQKKQSNSIKWLDYFFK